MAQFCRRAVVNRSGSKTPQGRWKTRVASNWIFSKNPPISKEKKKIQEYNQKNTH